MEASPPKVNKWDSNAIKNALDDAVKDVLLNKFEYVECHKLLDGRLLISAIAVGFSLFALAWDYLNPFPQSKFVLTICVLCYFTMMGILTWYTSYIEQGIFCTLLNKDPVGFEPDVIWNASSSLKRFDHIYHLSLEQSIGQNSRKEAKLAMAVEKYYNVDGVLIYDRVVKDIMRLHSDIEHKKN